MTHPRLILHMLPTLAVGGGQSLLLHNIAAGDPARYRHIVCHVRDPDELAPAFLARGVPTFSLNVRGPASQPAALARLCRLMARQHVDLIHTNNTLPDLRFGIAAAAIFRLPVVNTLHTEEVIGAPTSPAARARARLLEAAARRTLRAAIAVSPSARDAWLPRMRRMGLGDGHVAVITPGVHLPREGENGPAARARARAALGLREDQPVLIHIGRLVPSKGQRTLLDILPDLRRRHPDLTLLLVGDGPDRGDLHAAATAASLNGAVRFLGSRSDILTPLAAADLFVFPSRTEGFGLAPLEALACGIPVVAFDLPTLRRFVLPGRTGALVPQEDAAALADAVETLLADPAARAQLSQRARELIAAEFSISASAAAIESLYDEALARHKDAHRRPHGRLAHLS